MDNAKQCIHFTTGKVIKGKRCYRTYIKLNDADDAWAFTWSKTNRLNLAVRAAFRQIKGLRKLKQQGDMIEQ